MHQISSSSSTATPRSFVRRASLPTLLAMGLLAAVPVSAGAVSVVRDGAVLRYTGSDAADSVILSFDEGPGVVRLSSDTQPAPLAAGCEWKQDYGIFCSLSGASTVAVNLAGGADTFTTFPGATVGVVVDGGAGNDRLRSAEEPATFLGGPGDDELLGWEGDDVLDGGDGFDTIEGGEGADRLSGGAGADKLKPDPTDRVFADVVDGGEGVDEIDLYSAIGRSLGPIDLSLDGGGADGFSGEGDDIRGVERITVWAGGTVVGTDLPETIAAWGPSTDPTVVSGRGGNDVISASKADDRLDGGAGDDRLVGGFGNDAITGGPGRDVIIGDTDSSSCNEYSCTLPFGNDTIDARDGEADTVDCGVGTDTVYADAADTVAPNCESVVRGAAPVGGSSAAGAGTPQAGGVGAGGAAITAKTTRLRTALAKGLKLQLAGLPQGKTKVRVVRGRTLVASGTAKVSAGGTATVRLTFTRAARKALARSKKVTLKVTAGGKSATVVLTK